MMAQMVQAGCRYTYTWFLSSLDNTYVSYAGNVISMCLQFPRYRDDVHPAITADALILPSHLLPPTISHRFSVPHQ
jgi:hypothetical protein